MTLFRSLALGAVILPFVSGLPSHAPVDLSLRNSVKREYGPPPAYEAPVDRAQGVVDTFRVAWEGYYEHAFPNDELKPATNGFSNSR
jgi:mannosyl-oligosaccharide alpha-1,2-mannosidase